MHRWIAIGVVVLTLTLLTHGFSNGQLPIDACGSGPRHGNAEESPPPITIQVSHQDGTQSTTYTPGEILTVTITDTKEENFMGILLWAENTELCSVGEWKTGDDALRLVSCTLGPTCTQSTNNAIAHSGRLGVPTISIDYTVPLSAAGSLKFVVHVVINYSTFWVNVVSPELFQATTTTTTTFPTTTDQKNTTIEEIITESPLLDGNSNTTETALNLTESVSNVTANLVDPDNTTLTTILPLATNETETPLSNEANFTDGFNLTEVLGLTTDAPNITESVTSLDGLVLTTQAPDVNFTEAINTTAQAPAINTTDNVTDIIASPTEIPELRNLTEILNVTTLSPLMLNETENLTEIVTLPTELTFNETDNLTDIAFPTEIPESVNLTESLNVTTLSPLLLNETDNITEIVTLPTELSLNKTDNLTDIALPTEKPASINLTESLNVTTLSPLMLNETDNVTEIVILPIELAFNETDNLTDIALPTELPELVNLTESLNVTTLSPLMLNETDNITEIVTIPTELSFNETDNATDIALPTEIPELANLTETSNVTTLSPLLLNETGNVTEIVTPPTELSPNETDNMTDIALPTEIPELVNLTESLNVTTLSPLMLNETDNVTEIITLPTELSFNETDNVTDIALSTEIPTSINLTESLNVTTLSPLMLNETDNVTEIVTLPTELSFNETDNATDIALPTEIPELVNLTETSNVTTLSPLLLNETDNVTEIVTLPAELSFNETDNATDIALPTGIPESVNLTETSNVTTLSPLLLNETSVLSFNETENVTTFLPDLTSNSTDNTTDEFGVTTVFPEANITESMLENSTDIQLPVGFTTDAPMNFTDNGTTPDELNITTEIPQLNTTENNSTIDEIPEITDFPDEGNTTEDSNTTPLVTGFPVFNDTEIPLTPSTENTTLTGSPNAGIESNSTTISPLVTETDTNTTDFHLPTVGIDISTPETTEGNATTDFPKVTTPTESNDNATILDIGTPPPFDQKTTLIDDNDTSPPETTTPEFNETTVVAVTTPEEDTTIFTTSTSTTEKPTTTPTTTTTTTTPQAPPKAVDNTDPANQPKQVSMKLSGDFDTVVGDKVEEAKIDIARQLATIMNIDVSRIQNLKLSSGSVQIDFTLAPDESGAANTNTDEAVANLKEFMGSGRPMTVNGEELPPMSGTLESEPLVEANVEDPDSGGLRQSTKIVLGVVFGLIGAAIIIAIIVICVRQRKSHGFLMMRAARNRKDYGIPLRSMDQGRNGNGMNGHNGNHGFTRA